MWEWTVLLESDNKMTTNGNKRACNRWNYRLLLAEDTGLESVPRVFRRFSKPFKSFKFQCFERSTRFTAFQRISTK